MDDRQSSTTGDSILKAIYDINHDLWLLNGLDLRENHENLQLLQETIVFFP